MLEKAQSATEFLITYGWAMLLIIIVLSLLYYFILVPQKSSSPVCTIATTLLCSDLNIGTYPTGATIVTFYFNNQQTYPIANPRPIITYSTVNYSGSCYPTFVPAGGRFLCQVNLQTATRLDQFLSGSIYLTINNCGLLSNFLTTYNCTGAPTETLTGQFSGHTETPITFYAYVDDSSKLDVYVVNLQTDTVVNTISVPATPYGIVASPFSGYVYVAYNNGGTKGIAVINTSHHTVVNTIILAGGPKELALSAYGTYLYADGGSTLYTITTSNDTIVNTLTLGGAAQSLALSPNGRYIYAGEHNSNTIEVVNLKGYIAANFISTNNIQPYWIVSAPYNPYVYYIGDTTTFAGIFSTSNYMVVNTITVQSSPEGISVTPDGNLLFVANSGSSTVSIINTTNDMVVETLSVGSGPQGSVTSLFGTYTYITDQSAGTLSIVNTSTLAVANIIGFQSGAQPYQIALALH